MQRDEVDAGADAEPPQAVDHLGAIDSQPIEGKPDDE
jgi:hypothetical protein